jgi:hypothetical protein
MSNLPARRARMTRSTSLRPRTRRELAQLNDTVFLRKVEAAADIEVAQFEAESRIRATADVGVYATHEVVALSDLAAEVSARKPHATPAVAHILEITASAIGRQVYEFGRDV